MGSVEERCIHQFLNPVWDRCKTCAYDPENNKKCNGYSPTAYDIPINNKKLAVPETNLSIIYSVVNPDLNKKATA